MIWGWETSATCSVGKDKGKTKKEPFLLSPLISKARVLWFYVKKNLTISLIKFKVGH